MTFQTPVPVPAWRRVLAARTNILWMWQLRISALLVLSIVHMFYMYCYSESEKPHVASGQFFLFPEDKNTDTTYTFAGSQAKVDTGGTRDILSSICSPQQ